jgi:methionyl-tRNA formyltransferase
MRILFMGSPSFAVPSLKILLDHNYEIPAVVTAPDKPRGRGQQVSFTPIKEIALRHQLPVLQPENLKDTTFIAKIQQLYLDLIVVVAFRILPREVYTIPKLGSFNLHASLLPQYRGAAPINWAIINGEQETGVTTFLLQDKVDSGSILLQAHVRIEPDETAGELYDKLAGVGAEIVLQTVQLIEINKIRPHLQDESSATLAPKIFKEHCRVDWTRSALQIHNFVRGLSPYPAALTKHKGKTIKIYKTAVINEDTNKAGIIIKHNTNVLQVGTGNGTISILEIQQQGKRRMGIEDFLRGYSINAGDRFE